LIGKCRKACPATEGCLGIYSDGGEVGAYGGKGMVSKELENLMSNVEKYRGKHVVAVEDGIIVVSDEEKLKKALEEMENKYPGKTPLITFVLEEEVMIL